MASIRVSFLVDLDGETVPDAATQRWIESDCWVRVADAMIDVRAAAEAIRVASLPSNRAVVA